MFENVLINSRVFIEPTGDVDSFGNYNPFQQVTVKNLNVLGWLQVRIFSFNLCRFCRKVGLKFIEIFALHTLQNR